MAVSQTLKVEDPGQKDVRQIKPSIPIFVCRSNTGWIEIMEAAVASRADIGPILRSGRSCGRPTAILSRPGIFFSPATVYGHQEKKLPQLDP
jgi:hypothetical protein